MSSGYRPGLHATTIGLAAVGALTLAVFASAQMQVELVSDRRDLLFTDAEPAIVGVRVTGAPSDADVVFRVEETESNWSETGQVHVPVREGTGEARLPLQLPNRGHYTLTVEASAGEASAAVSTMLGVVFRPGDIDPASPWGLFHIPTHRDDPDPADPYEARAIAQSFRRLGAAWARLNFWGHSYRDIRISSVGGRPVVTADVSQWKAYARALHEEGIHILGEIAQCPAALSSRPGDRSSLLDMGPLENRVRPRDYAEWDALMEWLAAQLAEEIDVWEIWNEPDFGPGFWVGTPEEFAELVRHTAAALRRGNPDARIACCGFVDNPPFAGRLFKLGIGPDIDMLSVHYTDGDPEGIAAWRSVLAQHALDIPLWNTEERSEVPFDNLAHEVKLSVKFLHVRLPGYDASRPLTNPDLTPRPPAIWYAVGAHCIGNAVFVGADDRMERFEAVYFRRGEERIAAFRARPFCNLFGSDTRAEATVAIEPLDPAVPPSLTDRLGRSREVQVRDGMATLTLDSALMYLNGARHVDVVGSRPLEPAHSGTIIVEAESGELSPGWVVTESPRFSGARFVQIWAEDGPDETGHTVRVPFHTAARGVYALYFSGNGLTRLAAPTTISPFGWRIDGGPEHEVREAIAAAPDIANAGEGLFPLGEVVLEPGAHTFILRLLDRRGAPDQNYALWFDAVVLRWLSWE